MNSRHAINPGGRTVARMPRCARRARSAFGELDVRHQRHFGVVHHRADWEQLARRISILVWRVLFNFQFLDFDELAAVHALSIGATVVTGNMRVFARVPARRFMECPLGAMQPRRSVAQWRLRRIESRYWGKITWQSIGSAPLGQWPDSARRTRPSRSGFRRCRERGGSSGRAWRARVDHGRAVQVLFSAHVAAPTGPGG